MIPLSSLVFIYRYDLIPVTKPATLEVRCESIDQVK